VRCGESISGKYTCDIKNDRAICKGCREEMAYKEVTKPELIDFLKDCLDAFTRDELLAAVKSLKEDAPTQFLNWYYSGNFVQMDTRGDG
jgi:recombinational DNA repair protein (RecF pathway)